LTFEAPVRLEVAFFNPSFAYRMTTIPGVERVDGNTVAYQARDFLEAHNVFLAFSYMSVMPSAEISPKA
jgi:D-aminopeptidase